MRIERSRGFMRSADIYVFGQFCRYHMKIIEQITHIIAHCISTQKSVGVVLKNKSWVLTLLKNIKLASLLCHVLSLINGIFLQNKNK
jgi:hypothetical protein